MLSHMVTVGVEGLNTLSRHVLVTNAWHTNFNVNY